MEVKPHAWLEIDEDIFGRPVYRGVVHWTPDAIAGEHRRVPIYTVDELREHGESCARMAREEAAKVCEKLAEEGCGDWKHATPTDCAAAIRKG